MKAKATAVKKRLSLAKGQLEGILKMVDDDRYCIDISNQILSAIALLKNTNRIILKAHLEACVKSGLGPEGETKIDEIINIIDKIAN